MTKHGIGLLFIATQLRVSSNFRPKVEITSPPDRSRIVFSNPVFPSPCTINSKLETNVIKWWFRTNSLNSSLYFLAELASLGFVFLVLITFGPALFPIDLKQTITDDLKISTIIAVLKDEHTASKHLPKFHSSIFISSVSDKTSGKTVPSVFGGRGNHHHHQVMKEGNRDVFWRIFSILARTSCVFPSSLSSHKKVIADVPWVKSVRFPRVVNTGYRTLALISQWWELPAHNGKIHTSDKHNPPGRGPIINCSIFFTLATCQIRSQPFTVYHSSTQA